MENLEAKALCAKHARVDEKRGLDNFKTGKGLSRCYTWLARPEQGVDSLSHLDFHLDPIYAPPTIWTLWANWLILWNLSHGNWSSGNGFQIKLRPIDVCATFNKFLKPEENLTKVQNGEKYDFWTNVFLESYLSNSVVVSSTFQMPFDLSLFWQWFCDNLKSSTLKQSVYVKFCDGRQMSERPSLKMFQEVLRNLGWLKKLLLDGLITDRGVWSCCQEVIIN